MPSDVTDDGAVAVLLHSVLQDSVSTVGYQSHQDLLPVLFRNVFLHTTLLPVRRHQLRLDPVWTVFLSTLQPDLHQRLMSLLPESYSQSAAR